MATDTKTDACTKAEKELTALAENASAEAKLAAKNAVKLACPKSGAEQESNRKPLKMKILAEKSHSLGHICYRIDMS